jgi:hypothetical protein
MTTRELITAVQQAVGVDADGIAGPKTKAAIAEKLNTTNSATAIQTAVGVDADGVLGPKSWQAIFDTIGGAAPQDPAAPPAATPAAGQFKAIKQKVVGRGVPPDSYLNELIAWGRSAPDEIFATNSASFDVLGKAELVSLFGPWDGQSGSTEWILHRKAAMLEILRCLGGFESSWKWTEGVDKTNKTSMANIVGQETGIFQVSYDSLGLEKSGSTLRACVKQYCDGSDKVEVFIPTMKSNHQFALEYCARLLRFNYRWDGPILRNEINSSLKRDAVEEFKALLA